MKADEEKVKKILDLMITLGSSAYKYFIPQSIAQVSRSPFGYSIDIASHIIYDQLKKMALTMPLATAYLEWHDHK